MSNKQQSAWLIISQGIAGDIQPVKYEIPYEPGASVLDGLLWVKKHYDPSLAFRFSCINANVCRECTMRIDGKVTYACTARLGPREIHVEPLPSKRHLKDLITATVPSRERLDLSQDD